MKTKPIQRASSVLALVALALSLLVVPAFAAPTATAALTGGTNVFPTDAGATRNFTVKVTNTATPIIGETIDWVRIVLPAGEAGIELKDASTTGSAPSGWTVQGAKNSRLQFLTYTAGNGVSSIKPGQNLSFTFPGTVARPLDAERSGSFTVATSSNAGQTTTNTTGDLDATVEIIEVLNGVAATAPTGVTDGTGTAGQTIDVTYNVKNYAQNATSVTGSLEVLTNPSAATPVNASLTQSVAPYDTQASTAFVHAVDLNQVSQDTNVAFRARASTAEVARTSPNFRIQVPSILDLDASSFAPAVTRSGPGTEGKSFTIDATQVGTPKLELTSGTLDFGGNSATLEAPVQFAGDADEQTLTFTMGETSEIIGAGILDGVFTFQAIDDNGFADGLTYSLADLIRIDDIAPILDLVVEIPEGQNGVKNGDTIGVSGTIQGTDALPETLVVTLVPDLGDEITVDVSTSQTSDGYTFSGSATADFSAPSNVEQPTDAYARSFAAQASIDDAAGNIGDAASGEFLVDNVIPYLQDDGRTGDNGDGDSIIEIVFTDVHPDEKQIEGGCDPRLYRIDGVPGRVSQVRFAGQTDSCLGSTTPEDGHNGQRTLVLTYDLGPDETPTVTYLLTDPAQARGLGMNPVTDGVNNDALRRTIDTISGIVPAAPTLELVERSTGDGASEPAYQDFGGRYWSRIGGADDVTVTFSGFEDGWKIQVTDGNGTVLNEEPLTRDKIPGTDQDAPGEDGESAISVPLPTLTGAVAGQEVARGLRFVSEVNNIGLELNVPLGLDNVVPTISTLSNTGGDVAVGFSENLVAGTNFASDWFGWENREADRRYYTAESVSNNGEDLASRIVSFGFEDPTLFGGVEYFFTSTGRQYVDRAGNLLQSQEQAA